MKNSVLGLAAVLLVGMVGSGRSASAAEGVQEISQSSFHKDVLASKQPVVVDFFATWCGPCQRLAPVMDDLSKKFDGKASFVRVDVDKNQQLAGQFGIQGIPAVLIFKDGKIVDSSVGLAPEAALSQKIGAAVEAK